MKLALIFLNGYYDSRYLGFYKREIEQGLQKHCPLICADGGVSLFHSLNRTSVKKIAPDVLIGDLDSCKDPADELVALGMHVVNEWVGRRNKDCTDGQLAVEHAIESCKASGIIIYGGLPNPAEYETDHFLGNLKLMRLGLRTDAKATNPSNKNTYLWKAEMRDALQTIHFVDSELRLARKNAGLQRVSLLAEHANTHIESSENLKWDLSGVFVNPNLTNTLRNEFIEGTNHATIRLGKGSSPVYVIHNWHAM